MSVSDYNAILKAQNHNKAMAYENRTALEKLTECVVSNGSSALKMSGTLRDHTMLINKCLAWKGTYTKDGFSVLSTLVLNKPTTKAEADAWLEGKAMAQSNLYLAKFMPNIWNYKDDIRVRVYVRTTPTAIEYRYTELDDIAWQSHTGFDVIVSIPLTVFEEDEVTPVHSVSESETDTDTDTYDEPSDDSSIECEEIYLTESIYRSEEEKPKEESQPPQPVPEPQPIPEPTAVPASESTTVPEPTTVPVSEPEATPAPTEVEWKQIQGYDPILEKTLTQAFVESVGAPKDSTDVQQILKHLFKTQNLIQWERVVISSGEQSQQTQDS